MSADVNLVEALYALELPARERPIFVDRAAIVLAKKRAAAVSIRKYSLKDNVSIATQRHIDGKRREAPNFLAAENRRIFMPILLAAGTDALIARTVAENRQSNASHQTICLI